ncbi:MAG TPA: response regulator [Capsulimonadaceae bacterium]|nr:response regulator [Capsulimonadaceae bacterium]
MDDRPENLMAMEAILEPLGYEILLAQSGFEALKLLLSQTVALIVLDVRMPAMDGFETAHMIRLREKTRYTPILFVTANQVDERDLLQAHMAGGIDYIQQPLRPDVLSKKVRLIVEQMHTPSRAFFSPLHAAHGIGYGHKS